MLDNEQDLLHSSDSLRFSSFKLLICTFCLFNVDLISLYLLSFSATNSFESYFNNPELKMNLKTCVDYREA